MVLQALGSLPVPIWNSTPTYSYLCQHPYLLLRRCTQMSSTVVVCVNPRRRRWCRDGIPDSGNAVQIPSLLPLTAISFSPCPPTIATLSILQEVLVALVAGRRCDVKHAGAGAPGSSNTPSVPPRASLCHKTNSSAKRLCQYTSITASISGFMS